MYGGTRDWHYQRNPGLSSVLAARPHSCCWRVDFGLFGLQPQTLACALSRSHCGLAVLCQLPGNRVTMACSWTLFRMTAVDQQGELSVTTRSILSLRQPASSTCCADSRIPHTAVLHALPCAATLS